MDIVELLNTADYTTHDLKYLIEELLDEIGNIPHPMADEVWTNITNRIRCDSDSRKEVS